MLTLFDAIKGAIDNLTNNGRLTFANVVLLKTQSVHLGADSTWIDDEQLAEEPKTMGKHWEKEKGRTCC